MSDDETSEDVMRRNLEGIEAFASVRVRKNIFLLVELFS